MRYFDYADKMPGSYQFYFLGDLHLGNAACKVKLYEKTVRSMRAKKNAYCGLGGDMMDSIAPSDPRFQIDAVDPLKMRLSKQWSGIVDLTMPIADRVLYVMDGNHEEKHNAIVCIAEEVAKGLGIEYTFPGHTQPAPAYGTYLTKVDLGAVRALDWHGWGFCNSTAGDQNQIETNEAIWVKRKLRKLSADCEVMVMHHIHRMRICPPTHGLLITTDRNGELRSSYVQPTRIPIGKDEWRIPEDERWYGSSGSFLGGLSEGYSGYAERFGLPPTDMGCLILTVKNDKIVSLAKNPVSD